MNWIDEIEDQESLFEELKKAVFKSRTCRMYGYLYTMRVLIDKVKDDEYTAEDSGPISATDAKELTKKRVGRDFDH